MMFSSHFTTKLLKLLTFYEKINNFLKFKTLQTLVENMLEF